MAGRGLRTAGRRAACLALAGAVATAVLLAPSGGEAGAARLPALRLREVASLTETTAFAVRARDPARYVTVQTGQVVAVTGEGRTRTVLDLTGRVRAGGEQGLLGLAFDPSGTLLYVHYSGRAAGETIVEEYRVTGADVDPASRRLVLTQTQPQSNHNGGQLAFGPDGFLYLGLGDGGASGDQGSGHAEGGNGQSLQTLLGKILRIDPRATGDQTYTVPADNPFVGRDGRDEIWVYGLRNPWRFSFDRKNGDLWIGDVGQNAVEEVTRLPAASAAGANLGWNVFEGDRRYRDGTVPGAVAPVATLAHADGNCSVISGYVYRGRRIPALRGWHLFTDYCEGTLRAVRVTNSGRIRERALDVTLEGVSSFGQDEDGELYLLSQSDGIFRIEPA